MRSRPFGLLLITALLLPSSAWSDATREVLDLEEAAMLLRVKPELVQALAQARRLPARLIGEDWRFSRSALIEWLAGRDGAAMAPAQATPAAPAKPDPSAPKPSPPAIGVPNPNPTAEEVALRDQRVLLPRGALTLELAAAFARSERGLFSVLREEQRTSTTTAALRYGLLDDLQATLRLPWIWRRSVTYTDPSIAGSAARRASRDDYLGDLSASLLGVAWREASGRPGVVWSVDAVLPTGGGDRGIGAGLVLSKSFDPAVLFAGFSALRGFAVDANDARRSLARTSFGLTLGYTYALNDTLALNAVFLGQARRSRLADAAAIPSPRERYQLQWGLTWMLARGLFVEPSVGLRLGAESADLAAGVSVHASF